METSTEMNLTKYSPQTNKFYRAVTNNEADWSREFRNISMYNSQHLKNWVLIVPQRKRREADDFIGILQRAGNGMRYEVGKPQM